MSETLLRTLPVALALAAIHPLGRHLRFLDGAPRARLLSVFGGVGVAYVFLHLLPELSHLQEEHHASLQHEQQVYLFGLLGLVIFYGLERWARSHREDRKEAGKPPASDEGEPPTVFWIHLASYALYNLLVGYLLTHREDASATGLAIYTTAMVLHFAVNDAGLRRNFPGLQGHVGRWVLAAAPLLGYGLGLATELGGAVLASGFALLAGGVILNTLKEELPEEAESSWWAFALGAAGFGGLLLLV